MSAVLLILSLAVASFAAAVWLTGLLRVYALHAQLVDEVNARASHTIPTPRGGGVSIVIVAMSGFLASAMWLDFPTAYAVGLCGGGLAIALIGWFDDHGHVEPALRLATHFAASIWAVAWIGPLPLDFLPMGEATAMFEWPLTVLLIAWSTNLFNFMDGIDGIAASEAASVALAGAVLLFLGGAGTGTIVALVLLAIATLGFLPWNWPPARIFMGDASSGFLGFALASFTVIAGGVAREQGVAWIVLLGVFMADATVTLLRRAARREKIHEAHRSHAYQRLARRCGRHLPVTLGAIAVTWLWLFPIAFSISTAFLHPVFGVCIAYVPLVAAALLARAGSHED